MLIKSNHPFLASSAPMNELCKPLHQLGISYFAYTKSENSGARTYLTTHPLILENYLKKDYFLVGNSENNPEQYQKQIVFWDTLPNQAIFDENARAFGFDHGIFIINPIPGGCEFFGFATKKGNEQIINIYLNNMENLNIFTQYFKDRAQNLIQKAESRKIILPFNNDPMEFSEVGRLNMQANASLSRRQLEVSKYLLQGKTSKEIAGYTNLSHRTIEFYINILKSKYSCKTRAELIVVLAEFLKKSK